jgi:two-component system, OmpR family, sensor kinase
MTSIRKQLLWTLLPAVLVLLAIAVLAVLREVRDELNELFDAQLAQASLTLPATPVSELPPATGDDDDDPRSDLVVATWAPGAAEPVFLLPTHAPLSRQAPPGFSTQEIAGVKWRVFIRHDGERTVAAAQPLRVRDGAEMDIAEQLIVPLTLLVPAIILTVLFLVQRGLRPLTRFAHELDSRRPDALASLPLTALPAELLPMATAMNDLLARLSRALAAQEVFIADAAHELLTPLTALQVQVQMLERARSEERRTQATADVRSSLERCIALARQLLTLARYSGETPPARDFEQVPLLGVVRAAVAEVLPKAHARGIDLGVTSSTDCVIQGDDKALLTLLANLLDNAIKYSPQGSRVDVAIDLRERAPVVTVSDGGPGIAAADQARVFDRFYRSRNVETQGSGLGLAIALEIAIRHGAQIALRTPGRLGGLDAEVVFQG